MISTRYHLFTVISLFLALGIGILIGGSLGQQWLSEKQHVLVDQLEQHYLLQQEKNRLLTEKYNEVNEAYLAAKSKTDELLRVSLKGSLANRYFLLFSTNNERALRLQKMIEWAGGHVKLQPSLNYLPVETDGIILFGDEFNDQMDGELLNDLQLLYQAPIVVHTNNQESKWQMPHVHTFNGSMGEVLTEYHFLKNLSHIIPPYKEAGHGS